MQFIFLRLGAAIFRLFYQSTLSVNQTAHGIKFEELLNGFFTIGHLEYDACDVWENSDSSCKACNEQSIRFGLSNHQRMFIVIPPINGHCCYRIKRGCDLRSSKAVSAHLSALELMISIAGAFEKETRWLTIVSNLGNFTNDRFICTVLFRDALIWVNWYSPILG